MKKCITRSKSVVSQFLLRLFLLSLILTCAALLACRVGARTFNPGDAAPDFELPSLDGTRVALSSFKGKVILLNFWASWCGPCLVEMPHLERLYRRLSGQGFEVVAVGVQDSLEALKEVRAKFNLSFPILVDETGEIKRSYGLTGFPESFVLDSNGAFILFLDPSDGRPIVRILGPREWGNEVVVQRLLALLPNRNS